MITTTTIQQIIDRLGVVAEHDISWSEACKPPVDAVEFAREAIFVICNSGMKNTVAVGIFQRVMLAIRMRKPSSAGFGHAGKCKAIDDIWSNRQQYFEEYLAAPDPVTYLSTLPWIGDITKFHLAKNFGVDVAKPDVHLQRLADLESTTAQTLCARLAAETGYRISTVDLLLWRACANGILDSRTGTIRPEQLEVAGP